MGNDKTNMIIAIALSLAVLLGWNYFIAGPQLQRSKEQAAIGASPTATTNASPSPKEGGPSAPVAGTLPGAGGAPGASGNAGPATTREAALARTPRLRIDTPALAGSIALRGGRVDDVSLKNYHETVDSSSPRIVLLSPTGGPNPYYAEFGWVAGQGAGPLPNADTVWTADAEVLTASKPVTLSYDNGQGLIFRRTVAVDDKYMFTIADSVQNAGANPTTVYPYSLVSRWGKPQTQGYYVLHEGMIGVLGDQGLQEVGYDKLAKDAQIGSPDTRGRSFGGVTGGFVGITDKYWAAATIPDQTKPYTGSFTERTDGPTQVYQANVLGDARTVAPGAVQTVTQRLFAGAKEVGVVANYERDLDIKRFDLIIDWGWFYFITKPMFKAIDFFFKLTGNFGIAILTVTLILKIFFLPIANRSYTSMAKMKALQPEMQAVRTRFADDKMKQQQAMMELYKKEKINPVAGCWPVLIQIPVFFALYKVLFVTIEMRHAPFFGWIRDLAAPDPTSFVNLFGLLPFESPGGFLHLGVWPIIMGITMFVQMKMNPAPPDPVQAQVFTFMPIIFTFMLGSFPAGLVIYWAWNNTLSVLQQYVIMKRNGVKVELWDNLRGVFTRKPKPAEAKG